MAEKQILFSTPMVQAILDGRKTQTRRVIKPQPLPDADIELTSINGILHIRDKNFVLGEDLGDINCTYSNYVHLPYQPGDILWVRETFYHAYATTTVNGLEYVLENTYYYKADYPSDKLNPPWKPSIHMPREAARIFLRVTNVRVERVQDITENDAGNEGVKDPYDYQPSAYYEQPHMRRLEINQSAFAGLWDCIYAAPKAVINSDDGILYYESYPWEDIQETREHKGKPWYVHGNPWVWVISFERIEL